MRFIRSHAIFALLIATLNSSTGLALATTGTPTATFKSFASTVSALQESMIAQAKAADPEAAWTIDVHDRGRAVIVEDGSIWEKGCISVTLIEGGELNAVRASAISARTGAAGIVEGAKYSACALSFVLHARSPLVPTLRGDVRIFAVEGVDEFYGGGIDLTPSYVVEEDCKEFHSKLASLCAEHAEPDTYTSMKKLCDDYFYLPARKEHRGVGGVFFDDCTASWAPAFAEALIKCALDEEGPYMPIVRRSLPLPFTEEQKGWQLLRRGRYIEFNLLYDRGVKFGLTPESVERVLVSSPPLVAFKYKASAEQPEGSPEAETLKVLRHPREWV